MCFVTTVLPERESVRYPSCTGRLLVAQVSRASRRVDPPTDKYHNYHRYSYQGTVKTLISGEWRKKISFLSDSYVTDTILKTEYRSSRAANRVASQNPARSVGYRASKCVYPVLYIDHSYFKNNRLKKSISPFCSEKRCGAQSLRRQSEGENPGQKSSSDRRREKRT